MPDFPKRFASRVDHTPGHGPWGDCHVWTGATNHGGYGRVSRNGRSERAHRVAWELDGGELPDGLCVLHTCDNPPCCNPAHLWLGTRAQNNADMAAKGRHPGNRRLTIEQVREIRAQQGKVKQAVLAQRYGVHVPAISRIQAGVRWGQHA